jgi:hypothetical protein
VQVGHEGREVVILIGSILGLEWTSSHLLVEIDTKAAADGWVVITLASNARTDGATIRKHRFFPDFYEFPQQVITLRVALPNAARCKNLHALAPHYHPTYALFVFFMLE